MTLAAWISIASLLLAVATFAAAWVSMHRRARVDYVTELEHRVADCEKQRAEQSTRIDALETQNYKLMVKVLKLENGH